MFRHSFRALARTPAFTVAAVLTLALGIGANVAIFSVVYGVLLRPLPYRDGDRLALVRTEADYTGAHRPVPFLLSATEFPDWRSAAAWVFAPAFYSVDAQSLTTAENGAEVIDTAVVSGEFFSTLGGPLAAGRPLDSTDDPLPRIVLSSRLAQRLFGSAPNAVGRPLTLTSRTYIVVGVVAPAFRFPEPQVDVWMPAGFVRSINPRCCGFRVLARLQPGATVEQARAVAQAVVERPAPGSRPAGNPRAVARSLRESMVAAARPALLVLFASVLIVLVVACSNLIDLLLVRNASRERIGGAARARGVRRATGGAPPGRERARCRVRDRGGAGRRPDLVSTHCRVSPSTPYRGSTRFTSIVRC